MINKDTRFLIVGLGLMGGSYAKALRSHDYQVTAIDIDQDSIRYALENNMITEGSSNDHSLIEKADVIISGLYPTTMIEWIKNHQQYIKPNTLLTDVSGVKCNVVDKVQNLLRNDLEFIASHPMAGKEVSGVQYADPSIFKEANFIITPTEKNSINAIDFMKEFAQLLGFHHISTLSCKEHDEMIGFLSQLTHAIAVSLMNTNDNTHLVDYTGDSFRDLTRIAKINEVLWSELFFLNKDVLIQEIDAFQNELSNLKDKLVHNDSDGLKKLFIQSTARRKLFDKK